MQALTPDVTYSTADAASWWHPQCKRSHGAQAISPAAPRVARRSERVAQVDGAAHLIAQALPLEAALVELGELLAAQRLT